MISKETTQFLSLPDGKKLAFSYQKGQETTPTIVFLGGYRSDMTGTKAAFLSDFCQKQGFSFLRFDYSGHGQSTGDFKDGSIGEWANDALTMIKAQVTSDMILIGSSMGGWIGLLVAQELGARIKGFIGIAAAPDFTHHVWFEEMNDTQRDLCIQQGYINTPDGDTLTLKLLQEREQHLIFDKPYKLSCPMILLQGKLDAVVPYQTAQKLANHISSEIPVEVIIVDDGDHRLARDEDLDLLGKTINKMLT